MKFIFKVESWLNLRPAIRVGQAETFVGFHCGNHGSGQRGAIGLWWNNRHQYGRRSESVISQDSGLWKRQKEPGFIPAQHGRNVIIGPA